MARNPIAEVYRPGECRWGAVGAVFQPGKKASDTSDREAGQNGRNVVITRAGGNAGKPLANLNSQPSAQQATHNGLPREPGPESDCPRGPQVGIFRPECQLVPQGRAQQGADDYRKRSGRRQPRIAVPTVNLHGGNDGVGPATQIDGSAKFFTGAYERRLIPRVGHNVPQEAPSATVAALRDLMKGTKE